MKVDASVDNVIILVSKVDLLLKLAALTIFPLLSVLTLGWTHGGLLSIGVFLLAPYPPRVHRATLNGGNDG